MSVIQGDCLEVMAGMEPESVDAICTDPPYGIGFMGRDWDDAARLASVPPSGQAMDTPLARFRTGKGQAAVAFDGWAFQSWSQQWAAAALRVARPGAYLLAFGGTRTVHRMTCALEDAGWIIRDMLVWAYAQGFPKSRANLKPAWEPIVLARKPGPLRELNIDAARIGTEVIEGQTKKVDGRRDVMSSRYQREQGYRPDWKRDSDETFTSPTVTGRWPANVILTDPILDGGWEGVVGGGESSIGGQSRQVGVFGQQRGDQPSDTPAPFAVRKDGDGIFGYGDTGTYSRFFLIPKAPTSERVLSDGRRSPHPTQKPEALIRHLVKLVTPASGLVLDPFLGSGTLGVVCDGLGIRWLGIERDPEYAAWAEDRISDHVNLGLGLDVPAPMPKAGKAPSAEPKRPDHRAPHRNPGGTTWGFRGQDSTDEGLGGIR